MSQNYLNDNLQSQYQCDAVIWTSFKIIWIRILASPKPPGPSSPPFVASVLWWSNRAIFHMYHLLESCFLRGKMAFHLPSLWIQLWQPVVQTVKLAAIRKTSLKTAHTGQEGFGESGPDLTLKSSHGLFFVFFFLPLCSWISSARVIKVMHQDFCYSQIKVQLNRALLKHCLLDLNL